MQITSGVLRVRYHLYNKIIKLKETITSIESELDKTNEDSEKYSKLSNCLKYSNENLRKQMRLYNFMSEKENCRFINLKKVVSYIVVLETVSIVDIVESLCYVFNKNYEFFIDDSNLQYFVENHPKIPKEKIQKEFYKNQIAYKKLREYITEDNKITQMKEPSFEEIIKFKDVGFTNRAIAILMDTALRNYEYTLIYELKKELKS